MAYHPRVISVRMAAVVLGVAALGGLPACSGGDDDGAAQGTGPSSSTSTSMPTSSSTSTTGPASSTSAPAPTATVFAGSTAATSVPPPPSSQGVALLTAVRVAGHGGFDRVVFEFRDDRLPGYDVAYAEPPIRQSASGDPVAVGGSAFLAVGFEPASGVDLGDTLEETYTGPRRVRGDTAAVVEVVHTGDFEANLDWVVGLRGKARYRVETLTGPARVVIDVATS